MEYKFSKENFEKIKQLAFDLELKADSLRQMALNLQYDLSDNSINTEQEILIETYRPWVKKLGQWHLADDDGKTRCGVPMLGNNYAKYIPENERSKCAKCFK
jgi:hypothetical protein